MNIQTEGNYNSVIGNTFLSPLTVSYRDTGAGNVYIANVGVNWQGFAVTTPPVPPSGSPYTNALSFTVRIYVLTATRATYMITDPSGNTSPSIPMTAGQEITLDPNAKITPTYSSLTWKFYGT